jgi:hypothetical protein
MLMFFIARLSRQVAPDGRDVGQCAWSGLRVSAMHGSTAALELFENLRTDDICGIVMINLLE